MKVKLYELLRMLCEDELVDGERVALGDSLYKVNTITKRINNPTIFDFNDSLLRFSNLNEECILIDRK